MDFGSFGVGSKGSSMRRKVSVSIRADVETMLIGGSNRTYVHAIVVRGIQADCSVSPAGIVKVELVKSIRYSYSCVYNCRAFTLVDITLRRITRRAQYSPLGRRYLLELFLQRQCRPLHESDQYQYRQWWKEHQRKRSDGAGSGTWLWT